MALAVQVQTKPLYLIVGASGSGKDTIVNTMCSELNLKKVKSYTTREPRDEDDYENHLFSTREEYKCDREQGGIVAETIFHSNYYWATKEQIDNSDFYIIDPRGVKRLKNIYPMLTPSQLQRDVIVVYVKTHFWERLQRMFHRARHSGQSISQAIWTTLKRFWNDLDEFTGFEHKADFVVHNHNGRFYEALTQLTGYLVLHRPAYKEPPAL